MSKRSKFIEELSILEFIKKKAREESDSGQSVNNNKETFKLMNRNNIKDNLAKRVNVNDSIRNARTYAGSESEVVKW